MTRGVTIVQKAPMRKVALSSKIMTSATDTLAQLRFDNALALFDEFVRSNVKHADAATLRGLESRFALRLQIQPSYWSQIKGRSRQIGERLARQFEQLCQKPPGWMDEAHGPRKPAGPVRDPGQTSVGSTVLPTSESASAPIDDDERFIVGLVLTYYRRHPQRARTRLLDLLGEVLTPLLESSPEPAKAPPRPEPAPAQRLRSSLPGSDARPAAARDRDDALWARTQAGVSRLKQKR